MGLRCDGAIFLKDQGRAFGVGRVRHFIKYHAPATLLSSAVDGEGVVLEVMRVVRSRDPATGLPIVQEPGTTRADVLFVPPESLLFGVHLCPVFSSITPAGRRALKDQGCNASTFTGSSPWFSQWFINTYAEEHVGLLFAEDGFRDLLS